MSCKIEKIKHVEGSAYNDVLIGDTNNNILSGKGGDDVLVSGGGNTTLNGGVGIDIFEITNYPGFVTIQDFETKNYEKINVSQFIEIQNFDELQIETILKGTKITLSDNVQIQLDNVAPDDLRTEHFIFNKGTNEGTGGWTTFDTVTVVGSVIGGFAFLAGLGYSLYQCRKNEICCFEATAGVTELAMTTVGGTTPDETISPKGEIFDLV